MVCQLSCTIMLKSMLRIPSNLSKKSASVVFLTVSVFLEAKYLIPDFLLMIEGAAKLGSHHHRDTTPPEPCIIEYFLTIPISYSSLLEGKAQ